MVQSHTEKAAALKERGTEAFKKEEWDSAVELYGEAIALSSSDHVLYSNRSAAYAGAKKYEEALSDACKCVELKPDFAKGYGRKGLAEYHMNKLIEAKQTYQEGLAHDPQSQVLKTGLRDTEKRLRSWFLTVLSEAAEAQSVVQQSICEATHQLVADGCTCLPFLEAHQKVLRLDLPQDTLEKYCISDADCQQTIADYERQYDYEVITAVQHTFMPSGKGDAERASKIDIASVVDSHKYMAEQMSSLVEEFTALPLETQQAIPKKERERAAELLVSVAVEAFFKIESEDLELAVTTHSQQLEGDAAFVDYQTQIASQMQLLMDPPFVAKVVEQASTSGSEKAKHPVSAKSLESSRTCAVGAFSALGLVVLLGLLRWRTNTK